MKPQVSLAKPSGFCYGVKRAVNLAEDVLKNKAGRKVYSLGGVIHNTDAVKRLSEKGLILKSDIDGVKKGDILVISSHGVSPAILEKAGKRGIKIVNATCPNVITSQHICERLKKDGYFVVIIGDKRHKEIGALSGFAGKNSTVIKDGKEARNKKIKSRKIGVIVQTTQSKENFTKVLKELIVKDYLELRIFNTVCNDTSRRQKAALDLSRKVDTMLVVGGKHSANTRRLFELCGKSVRKCHYIENGEEINAGQLRKSRKIGVVSGASTPDWVIEGVLKKIK